MANARKIPYPLAELEALPDAPDELWCEGDLSLLKRRKVAIVGTRRPLSYTKSVVTRLASELARRGAVVVSGGAMGVDATAHKGAGAAHTICVTACGLDRRCPAVNASLHDEIGRRGLLLSRFAPGFRAHPWSFVVRNGIVVALGEVLVVAEAEPGSGSMRSVEYALKLKKEIFVLPHRLGESRGTQELLEKGLARPIFDIGRFADRFGEKEERKEDGFVAFCRTMPTYEEAVARFGEKVFEAELEGTVVVRDGRIIPL